MCILTPEAIEAYRRAHLGRSGRPKGARNKPKAPTTAEGANVDANVVEPTREGHGDNQARLGPPGTHVGE